MPRAKSTTAATMAAAYTYAPGDHHRYVWDGGSFATVERITVREGSVIELQPTGDKIPMEGVARTVTAFAGRIDSWRGSR